VFSNVCYVCDSLSLVLRRFLNTSVGDHNESPPRARITTRKSRDSPPNDVNAGYTQSFFVFLRVGDLASLQNLRNRVETLLYNIIVNIIREHASQTRTLLRPWSSPRKGYIYIYIHYMLRVTVWRASVVLGRCCFLFFGRRQRKYRWSSRFVFDESLLRGPNGRFSFAVARVGAIIRRIRWQRTNRPFEFTPREIDYELPIGFHRW